MEESDCNEITNVFIRSFLANTDIPIDRFERIKKSIKIALTKELTNFISAYYEDKMVGIGGVTNYIGSSFIGYIGVLPDYRGKGIGSKIFSKCLDCAKENNNTIELFSNIGADTIYRRFDFKDEFNTFIYEIQNDSKIELSLNKCKKTLPTWLMELDKEAMGFDRSKFLNILITDFDYECFFIENKGFLFSNGKQIGPVIATTENVFHTLINDVLGIEPQQIIIPERLVEKISKYSPKKIQTCIKMLYGPKLPAHEEYIYGYNSFARS